MAAKTVAERQSEADLLMRSGLGLTVIADIGSDTVQVKDPLGTPSDSQPAGATVTNPAVVHTDWDVNWIAVDSPAAELAAGATINIAEGRGWHTYAGGEATTEYLA